MKKVVKPIIFIGIILIIVGVVSTIGVNNIIEKLPIKAEEGTDITKEELPTQLMEKIRFSFGTKYYELYYEKKIKAKNLPNAAKLYLAGAAYRRKNKSSYQMTKEDMKKELINIFGSNVEYKDGDFNAGSCFAESMTLENNIYKFQGGCGSLDLKTSYRTKIIKAVKKETYIEITEKAAYVMPTEVDMLSNKAAYNVYDKKDGKLLGKVGANEEFDINKYLNDLKSYKYKFVKEGDNYYFDSVKKGEI